MRIGDVEVKDLVESCGTPLNVYDEVAIENQMTLYAENFKSEQFATEVLYASKAFTCGAILEKVKAYGLGLDVVSGGELYVASKVKFAADKIYFHGNNKTLDELEMALNYGVKTLVIDNMFEVDTILETCLRLEKKAHVLIRLNPKVEAHTHEYIMTATSDSKFGISIDLYDEIMLMIEKISANDYVVFDGFHSHIGSQIFEQHAFVGAIEKMIGFIAKVNKGCGKNIVRVLNIGGGFGVRYTEKDTPISTADMCHYLIEALEQCLHKQQVKLEKVCMEPGRSIVGEAGYTLYTVGFTKKTQNKEFLFVDGGMADNIRPALYGAEYAFDVANRKGEPKTTLYEIAGKCCESGDLLAHDVKLPSVQTGDVLVMYTTGAYGYSMASNYNRLNRPAVVFVKDGNARTVIKRETYAYQCELDTAFE